MKNPAAGRLSEEAAEVLRSEFRRAGFGQHSASFGLELAYSKPSPGGPGESGKNDTYPLSNNHGSAQRGFPKGKSSSNSLLSTSMIVGGRVNWMHNRAKN